MFWILNQHYSLMCYWKCVKYHTKEINHTQVNTQSLWYWRKYFTPFENVLVLNNEQMRQTLSDLCRNSDSCVALLSKQFNTDLGEGNPACYGGGARSETTWRQRPLIPAFGMLKWELEAGMGNKISLAWWQMFIIPIFELAWESKEAIRGGGAFKRMQRSQQKTEKAIRKHNTVYTNWKSLHWARQDGMTVKALAMQAWPSEFENRTHTRVEGEN